MSLREIDAANEAISPQGCAMNMRMCIWGIRMGVLGYVVCIMVEMLLNMSVRLKLLQISASLCLLSVLREDVALVLWISLLKIRSKLLGTVMRFKAASADQTCSDSELQIPAVVTRAHVHVHSQDLHNFCSFLPSTYRFQKNAMVQMWVAEGLFEPETNVPMEIPASNFFDYLVQEKVFEFVFSGLWDKFAYMMHDTHKIQDMVSAWSETTHNFTVDEFTEPATQHISTSSPLANTYLSVDESELSKVSEFTAKLVLVSKSFNPLAFSELCRFKNLSTLILVRVKAKHIPYEVFLVLNNLRLLDLHGTVISTLPGSIQNLKCLRYLDMSATPINCLPGGIAPLTELQTLKLNDCLGILKLPEYISKLNNLRHLDLNIFGLRSMPTGIGNLTKLQTLTGFLIANEEGCRIGELKNLNNLRGSLRLRRLDNVSSPEEAAEAYLINKKYLTMLGLHWANYPSDKTEIQEKILDRLQPHSNLEELDIRYYSGATFPNWLSDPLCVNIVTLRLHKCGSHHLPSLGGLLTLRFLSLTDMDDVKTISHLFRGTKKSQVTNAFPRLEVLKIDGMINLERWSGIKKGDFPNLVDFRVKNCPKLSDIPFLSYINTLRYLYISECPELQSLPKDQLSGSLKDLFITNCPKLKSRCSWPDGKDWSKIAHVPSIHIDHKLIYKRSHDVRLVEARKSRFLW